MSIASSAPTQGFAVPSSQPPTEPPGDDGVPNVPYNSSSDPRYTDFDFEPSTDYFTGGDIGESEIAYLRETNSKRHAQLTEMVRSKLLSFSSSTHDAAEERLRIAAQEPIELSSEQQQVHHMIVHERKSMFFTGAAGTGKSILLRRVIEDLRRKHGHHAVAVTAPTGIAAVTIGGRTLHAWSGIGLGQGDVPSLLRNIKRSKPKCANWAACKVLIIDEISMLSPELFDKLNEIAKKMREYESKRDERESKKKRTYTGPDRSKLPFGGIQLVVCGDFYQLPPVDKNRATGSLRKFAFDSQTWKECIHHTILLTQVFRQKDQRFQDMLNEARFGKMSEETIDEFRRMNRPPQLPEGVVPTKLFPLREEVERANKQELDKLASPMRTYKCVDYAFETEVNGHKIPAPDPSKIQWTALPEVRLKEGAQVMMIKNIDETLVNGSVGKIIKFIPKPPSLQDDGRACVALSDMIQNVGGLVCSELERLNRKLDKITAKVDTKLDTKADATADIKASVPTGPVVSRADAQEDLVPLVRFYNRDGTVREVVVCAEEWVQENELGQTMAKRVQIPLILAYALSIHKSQGQTLDFVSVNMIKAFEAGQTYVALSRATSLEGLQIIGFDPRKVLCDNRVARFYAGLTQITRSYQPSVTDMFRKREPAPEPEGNVAGMFDQFVYKRAKTEDLEDCKVAIKAETLEPETLPDLPPDTYQPMPGAWPTASAAHTSEDVKPSYPPIDLTMETSSDIELPCHVGKQPPPPGPEPFLAPFEIKPDPDMVTIDYDSDFDAEGNPMVHSGRKNYNSIY